eukprot:snap_masked-scaffold_21-processed-gene-5.46-mRNA-1 protein AED:1.00 eAED:1.00 QI:0/0/0/0/1/1/2/0/88
MQQNRIVVDGEKILNYYHPKLSHSIRVNHGLLSSKENHYILRVTRARNNRTHKSRNFSLIEFADIRNEIFSGIHFYLPCLKVNKERKH